MYPAVSLGLFRALPNSGLTHLAQSTHLSDVFCAGRRAATSGLGNDIWKHKVDSRKPLPNPDARYIVNFSSLDVLLSVVYKTPRPSSAIDFRTLYLLFYSFSPYPQDSQSVDISLNTNLPEIRPPPELIPSSAPGKRLFDSSES